MIKEVLLRIIALLRLWICATLVSIGLLVNAQQYSHCLVNTDAIVPSNLLNPKPYLFYKGIEKGDIIRLNKVWISKMRLPGVHCYMNSIRKVTKKDFKENVKLQMERQMQGTNLFYMLNSNTAIYGDSVYTFTKQPTQFKSWLGIETKSYDGQELFSIAISSESCGKQSLDNRYRSIDLYDYSTNPLRVIFKRNGFMNLLAGDSLVIGGIVPAEYRNIPLAIDAQLLNQIQSFEVDSALIGRRVILGNFDFQDLKRKSYPSYVITNIVFKLNENHVFDPTLILRSHGNPNSLFSLSLKYQEFSIYDESCFGQIWNSKRDQYLQYLSRSFTSKEREAILQSEVFVGMSEPALFESIGRPKKINETVFQGLRQVQCVYGNGIFVYIKNGKVNAYQNLESLSDF